MLRAPVAAAFALALAAAAGAVRAQPAPPTAAAHSPTEVVYHHMTALAAGDISGLLDDYADDAVLIAPGQVAEGKTALTIVFQGMVGGGAAQKPVFRVQRVWAEGDVGFVAWQMNPDTDSEADGVDGFLVRDGKIHVQTVFPGAGLPQAAPAAGPAAPPAPSLGASGPEATPPEPATPTEPRSLSDAVIPHRSGD